MRYWLRQALNWLVLLFAAVVWFLGSAVLVGIWLRTMLSWLNA